MNKATRLTASILCGLSLSTIAQIASAGDQIHVNKRGDLVIRLGDHNSYRLLSLYSTGIPNQVGYDIETGDQYPQWGKLNNVTRNVIIRSDLGTDTISIDNLNLPGNVTVFTGGGDDNVVLNHSTVSGRFTVRTGAGDDYVELNDSTVFGNTDVRTSQGHDDVFLVSSSLEGQVKIPALLMNC